MDCSVLDSTGLPAWQGKVGDLTISKCLGESTGDAVRITGGMPFIGTKYHQILQRFLLKSISNRLRERYFYALSKALKGAGTERAKHRRGNCTGNANDWTGQGGYT